VYHVSLTLSHSLWLFISIRPASCLSTARHIHAVRVQIQRLPPVLCFHLKRFEHSATKHTSTKLECWVRFPLHSLQMHPFLAAQVLGARCKYTAVASAVLPPDYELSAVVAHMGQLEGGHYVAYVRMGREWYKCDDAWITRVHESTVRQSQAYLLYYSSKGLAY
jgi:ubiquitin carboxyl-terminal hydrolase 22/27/51